MHDIRVVHGGLGTQRDRRMQRFVVAGFFANRRESTGSRQRCIVTGSGIRTILSLTDELRADPVR